MKTSKQSYTTMFAVGFSIALFATTTQAQDWTQFRGSGGRSVSNADLPTSFDDEKNIAWKKELPAKGASGPIVVDDKVIVTCSGGADQDQLYTICFDANTGKELWTQKFWATGRTLCHPLSANAAPTPASDGERIYSFYSSNDLACLDLDGNLVWYRALAMDHPKAGNDVGMSSSPVVHNGVVVAQCEGHADAFVIGLDAATGKTLWEVTRKHGASWSSPLLLTQEGKPSYVVIQSRGYFTVLNLQTGETAYESEGKVSTISSAAVEDGRLYLPVDGTTVFKIGDTGSLEQVYGGQQVAPRSMSTVVNGDKMYTINGAGVLNQYSTTDGTPEKRVRVGGSGDYWATPVIARDHMYFFTQKGVARVVDLKEMEVVHKHQFEDEVFLGSPAVSEDAMFIRSDRFLWKIAKTDG